METPAGLPYTFQQLNQEDKQQVRPGGGPQ